MTFPFVLPVSFPGSIVDVELPLLDVDNPAYPHVSDWPTRGKDLLIQQYKGKPVIEAILSAVEQQLEKLSDAEWRVLTNDTLADGPDNTLERDAVIVGAAPRGGLGLDGFRLVIKATVLVNRSKGRPDDLLKILVVLWPGQPWTLTEWPVAEVDIEQLAITDEMALITFRLLKRAKDAGVRLFYLWNIQPASDAFTFSDTSSAVVDSARGFSDTTQAAGGVLSGVYSS